MKANKLKCKSIRSYFERDTAKKTQASANKILSDTFGHSDFKSSLQKEAVLCVSEGELYMEKFGILLYCTMWSWICT